MTEGTRLKVGIGIALAAGIIPVLFLLFGGPERMENWSKANRDSPRAEWTARKVAFIYKVTLRPKKHYRVLEWYLEVFNEESKAYDEDMYKKMLWEYGWAASEHSERLKAGMAFYDYAVLFPDDECAEQAANLAKDHGYRPRY